MCDDESECVQCIMKHIIANYGGYSTASSTLTIDGSIIEGNIAFARGGDHLPIAHALRLPEPTKNKPNLWAAKGPE